MTVVVEDDRQPRSGGLVPLVAHPEVEGRVVGLPDLIGSAGLAAAEQAVEQVELLPIGCRPLVRERDQGRVGEVEPADHVVDPAVAGHRPALLVRHGDDPALDGRGARRRPLEGQTFDELLQLGGEMAGARVAPRAADQTGEPRSPIAGDPPLQGPVLEPVCLGPPGPGASAAPRR